MDVSGFVVAVTVISRDRRFNLWTLPAAGGMSSLDPENDLAGKVVVESLELEMGRGYNSRISVKLAAPFDVGLELLRSSLFKIGNTMEVTFGYPKAGKFMPAISTFVERPSISLDPVEGLSASLEGSSGMFAGIRGTRSAQYTNMSYADIIRRIVDEGGYGVDVVLPDPTGSDDPLYVVRESVSQQNHSDWFFIRTIAADALCDVWVGYAPSQGISRQQLVVSRRSEDVIDLPKVTLIARGDADFERVWPILQFETDAEGVWLPGGAQETSATVTDPETGTEVTVRSTPTDEPGTGDAAPVAGMRNVGGVAVGAGPDPAPESTGARVYVPGGDPQEASQQVAAFRSERAAAGSIKINVTTFGIVDLFPNDKVHITGLGVFDGDYLVDTVSHSLSAGEWSMNLQLFANALSRELLDLVTQEVPSRPGEPHQVNAGQAGGDISVEPEES